MKCPICKEEFDPKKDFFVTINERKAASVNFCSLTCATRYYLSD